MSVCVENTLFDAVRLIDRMTERHEMLSCKYDAGRLHVFREHTNKAGKCIGSS